MKVCPSFGAPLIKRVVDNFVPDEFCPDPIPGVVLEALDSEVTQLNLHSFFTTQLSILNYLSRIALCVPDNKKKYISDNDDD